MTLLPNHVLKLMRPEDRAQLGKAGVTTEEAIAAQDIRCERDLQNQLRQYAQLKGWIVLTGAFGKKTRRTAGEADQCFLLPSGITLFVEAKTETGKLSDDQAKMKAAMEKLGHTMHVVRSLDEFRQVCVRVMSEA